MKKLVLLLLYLAINFFIFGQDQKDSIRIELQSIDISTGRSALSSGFSLDLGFKSPNANTLITLRQDRVFINHFLAAPKLKLKFGPSAGYLQNVPFIGAIAKFSPAKFISTLHWVGYSFGVPNAEMGISPSFLFLVNNLTLEIRQFRTYYSAVTFIKLPTKHVVGILYQYQIAKNIQVYSNVGYDFTNNEQLLLLGVAWKKED